MESVIRQNSPLPALELGVSDTKKKAKRSVIVSNPTITTTSGTQSVVGERAATGVSGIDEMIEGGFPRGSVILLLGGPGTGKTILAATFLYNGVVRNGESGIYISFSEDRERFYASMGRLGYDFARLEKAGKFEFIEVPYQTKEEMGSVPEDIMDAIERVKPTRLVIDSFTSMAQSQDSQYAVRRIVQEGVRMLIAKGMGCTTIIIGERPVGVTQSGPEEFVADGIISLTGERKLGQLLRRFEILKMRGTQLNTAERRYGITRGGFIVYPNPTLNLENLGPSGKRKSSGIVTLDKMLGGGFLGRSWTMIAGSSGTGKTTVALHFINEGNNRGEKSVYISYEETVKQLAGHASGFGWTLQPFVDKGVLKLMSFDVEQLNFDDHLFELCTMLESFKPARLVIDSIDPVKRMVSEDDYIRFTKNLITVTRRVGATVMLTAFARPSEIWIAGPDISSIVDNMISLRDVEASSVLKRSLIVLKERGTKHAREIREFEITNRGVILKEKFEGVEQILSGTPRKVMTAEAAAALANALSRKE